MKHRYRISPEGAGPEPTDAELLRYRDHGKLIYGYQRARDAIHRKPLYRDPKAFLILIIIALVAWLVSRSADDRTEGPTPGVEQQP